MVTIFGAAAGVSGLGGSAITHVGNARIGNADARELHHEEGKVALTPFFAPAFDERIELVEVSVAVVRIGLALIPESTLHGGANEGLEAGGVEAANGALLAAFGFLEGAISGPDPGFDGAAKKFNPVA